MSENKHFYSERAWRMGLFGWEGIVLGGHPKKKTPLWGLSTEFMIWDGIGWAGLGCGWAGLGWAGEHIFRLPFLSINGITAMYH